MWRRQRGIVLERSPDVYLLTVHVKDLAMLRLELKARPDPSRRQSQHSHGAGVFSQDRRRPHPGQAGSSTTMLLEAFAEHLLGTKVDAHRIKPPLDLSVLRLSFDVPRH